MFLLLVLADRSSKLKFVLNSVCQPKKLTLFAHRITSWVTPTKNGWKPKNSFLPETKESVSVNSKKLIWISNTAGPEQPPKMVPSVAPTRSAKKPETTSTLLKLAWALKSVKWICAIELAIFQTKDLKCTLVSNKTAVETQATIWCQANQGHVLQNQAVALGLDGKFSQTVWTTSNAQVKALACEHWSDEKSTWWPVNQMKTVLKLKSLKNHAHESLAQLGLTGLNGVLVAISWTMEPFAVVTGTETGTTCAEAMLNKEIVYQATLLDELTLTANSPTTTDKLIHTPLTTILNTATTFTNKLILWWLFI
jgi:hypothetical protein